MMKKLPANKLGFTMIEILVVMAIIGILVTLGVRSFTSTQMKARDLRRKADLANLSKPLEAYFNDYDTYPLSSANGLMVIDDSTPLNWGDEFVNNNGTTYMVQLPEDPSSSRQYFYQSDGTYWAVYALLENTLDPDVVLDDKSKPSTYADTNCGNTECNYRLTSSNFE